MPHHYLFGPVTPEFAHEHLHGPRQAGHCLAFGPAGDTDLAVRWDDTWESLQARLPEGWRPDFVVLFLSYRTIPPCLWTAPVPLVGWAADSNLLWHGYRYQLPRCDRVLSDSAAVEAMARAGIRHTRVANLYGCGRSFLEAMPEAPERDIDILFVGNLQPAVQRERLSWLGRLARLGQRWRVAIRTGVFGADYRALLARSRIVFNRGIVGVCNQRIFEAAAAGALLFQEAENREIHTWFRDRQECVCYTEDNLEELLEHYLEHEDERRAIAEAARARVDAGSFENLWQQMLDQIERDWAEIEERSRRRPVLTGTEDLLARTWQALSTTAHTDTTLVDDLAAALARVPGSAALHNALGLTVGLAGREQGRITAPLAGQAVECFQRAVEADPTDVMAGLNLTEALVGTGQTGRAVEQARRTLAVLDRTERLSASVREAGHFPPSFDHFRVEWESLAWSHAGRPAGEERAKRELLRWRLHALLADLTGDLVHYHEAALARPDLPPTRAALGCALARAGRMPEAVPHLARATADNPFDAAAARALFDALGMAGDAEGQRRLVRDRRLLAEAAPQAVRPEEWFAVPARPAAQPNLAVVWEGAQRALHSLALVNREVCRRLIERGHELSLALTDDREAPTPGVPVAPVLAERFGRALSRPADVYVRHHWPPNFTRPPAGRCVLIQPWEFGSLPKAWVGPIIDQVDEVWAYSHYVRDCYVRSGVPAARVQVVPLGIDPQRFHPEAAPLTLRPGKRFKFLFVGGTIYRKGIDVLLEAYTRAFTGDDDVCLVVKDMGVGSFYQGQTAEDLIAHHQSQPGAPEIEYLDRPLAEAELAGLYTACDCLVQPYRGEGFGLPIAEAMACGLPVIVTGHGAALDFCDEATAYLIPAQVLRFAEKRIGDLETVDYPFLAEPDREALQQLLRHVVVYPAEAQARGQAASVHIRQHFTWDCTADVVERRIEELRQRPARRSARLRVSLCMMVKNEEANLPDCLGSAADLFDEIIVVDTGSTDRTKEVAAHLGARVFDFPWVDSFAAARNESLRHATGDWIFWLDADDRLDDANRHQLRELFAGLKDENAAYVMKCHCLPDPETGTSTVVDHVRLFRNDSRLRWKYRVHEQIMPAVRAAGADVRWAEVVIQHTGYQDRALRARKLERDLRLLRLEDAEHPDDPFTLFNLGLVYQELGRTAEAVVLFQRSLQRSQPTDSIVRKLFALLLQCHRQLGEREEMLSACRAGRRLYPEDAELLFQEGLLLREKGDLAAAKDRFLRLLQTREKAHFASVAGGLQGYKARHNLAIICKEQGLPTEAEAHWRSAVAEEPGFVAGWTGLGELYLAAQRWAELEELIVRLEAHPQGMVEAAVLRARVHLARKDFAAARRLLEEAVREHPQALGPRVILSHALLQEGRDWAAAERALREVLALAPEHAESRHNLAVLLRQRA